MKNLVLHINFLIQQHDCVIIPNFGGFVLNRESACIMDGVIRSPRFYIGFNQDLKYNDGLLAESYMNTYMLTYEAANKQIAEAVREIELLLSKKDSISFDNLGCIMHGEEAQSLVFIPHESSFQHPSVFGYSDVKMSCLNTLASAENKRSAARKVILQRVLRTTASVAAGILLFVLSSTSITENSAMSQQAGFFSDLTSSSLNVRNSVAKEQNSTHTTSNHLASRIPFAWEHSALVEDVPSHADEETVIKAKEELCYFVIVGSETDRKRANKILEKIKNKGFTDAAIVKSADKFRIYVSAFSDRDEANKYLIDFRIQNVDHKDAWLYCKK